MNHLLAVKVGDTLCLTQRMSPARLVVVDRITPSGRVVTKAGTFMPDNGRLYGGAQDAWNRVSARLATQDDIAGVQRERVVNEIGRFRGWDKLSANDLETVEKIIRSVT